MQQGPGGHITNDPATSGMTSPYTGAERRRAARSPIAGPQWTIPRVDVIAPEQVPTRAALLAILDPLTLAACRRAAGGDAAERRVALSALAALLPADLRERSCDPPALIVAGEGASPEVHDHFFRIRRVGHGHPAGYLQTLLAAWDVLDWDVAEASTTLAPADLTAIAQALGAALALALGDPLPAAPIRSSPDARKVGTEDAIHRWIHGHQVFAALTQVLIFAFEAIEAAAGRNEADAMFEMADLAALTLRGCAASLRFTGDFPHDVYEDLIRVSMGSPFQPDGFSGLLSSDHRHLVRRMKLTRPSLESLRERDAGRYEAIADALAGVYDAHKCVCSRFVGTDRSSLMMVREVGRSAIDHLDRFKSARMRSIGAEEAPDS